MPEPMLRGAGVLYVWPDVGRLGTGRLSLPVWRSQPVAHRWARVPTTSQEAIVARVSDEFPVAKARLRDAWFESKGQLYPLDDEIVSLPWVPRHLCNHDADTDTKIEDGSTICPDCLDSWMCDWEVWLPAGVEY